MASVAYLKACIFVAESVTGISMRFTPLALRCLASAYRPTHIASLKEPTPCPSLKGRVYKKGHSKYMGICCDCGEMDGINVLEVEAFFFFC